MWIGRKQRLSWLGMEQRELLPAMDEILGAVDERGGGEG